MTTRRPSTPKDAGPPRMPFASAEALIWGPELKKQHAYLLTEMRALQKQHEGYNARIQTTEAVAGAAEAATARIRHLEQKLVAIETEGDDKAFEKWAAEELARVTTEPDDDLMILPKSGLQFIPEEVQVPQSPVIQEKVPTSIDLTSPRKDLLSSARRRLFQRPSIHESKLPRLVGEGIQHTSPAHNEHSFLRNSPPAETQIVDRSLQAMAPLAQEAQPLPTNELPPTQIVNRAVPKKRKQSDPAPPTQRLTRSQAKKSREMEVKDEREQVPQPLVQSTQLPGPSISPRKKAKTDTAPAITNSKTKPTRAKQGAAKPRGRPRKEIVDAGSSEKKPVASTQPVAARPRKPRAKAAVSPTKKTAPIPAPQGAVSTVKQKRLMVTLPIPRKMPDSSLDGSENTQVSAGDRVKMSHQKAATTSPFKVIPKPLGTRSGNRQASPPAGQGEDDGELIPDEDDELLLA
ncbi:hypothetical protein PtrSN002B_008415 [Pyrenophora tritici-repentis]|uniref:Uncharacterized protein n=1 Tax=Pyrenophora tritici-repentis TaxID=45151 RepID=A0A2W1FUV9_9PLEO|nr:hypothetical protein PtrV1_10457 [Pyrenophora tritici-repentis]KAF7446437.1 hypothetical protein A1F99_097280 [Pyrenophora tritici-repentis]KAF7567550.1 hypothetical protein PtrM4_141410 [Pyrenophora tritici-repentis]KAI1529965.1 hypothetical protein PtrSN001A_008367 [Pyrenophora tritici-repentis]KAI1531695.1 hypothetical protein PtrSN001C_008233 [Pyrenophora tritici-repentis]